MNFQAQHTLSRSKHKINGQIKSDVEYTGQHTTQLHPITPMNLGLFGGTFDPIHAGHLAVAQEVIELALCDQILFIPASSPPHRENSIVTAIEHRREMVRLAIAWIPAFVLSDIEIKGPSYSYHTVEAIREMHNDDTNLSFIMGLDNLFDLPHWRNPQLILKLCDLIVVSRPGWKFKPIVESQYKDFFGIDIDSEHVEALDAGACNKLVIYPKQQLKPQRSITLLQVHSIDISSSSIREAITKKQEAHALLPTSVKSYILKSRLYTTEHVRPES